MSIYSKQHIGSFVTPLALKLGDSEVSFRRLNLLRAVGEQGSISRAAKAVGMTYKAAWDAVDAMNNLADQPLVQSQHGGSGGGGASLTPAGIRLVRAFSQLNAMQAELVELFERHEDLDQLGTLRSMLMKTSARNALRGTVRNVTRGAVNAEVEVELQGGDPLVAIVTLGSVDDLGLEPGRKIYALIKASFVILTNDGARTSARNRLCGTIERIAEGAVNSEVVLALEGGSRLTAIITEGSLETLDLKVGEPACALIKASHVILGVDD